MTAHQTAQTSIDAYRCMGVKLSRQQRQVTAYLAMRCHKDFTRGEIAEGTGMMLSSVTGRVNELLKGFVLVEGPRRPCSITGVAAHTLRLCPGQAEMFP